MSFWSAALPRRRGSSAVKRAARVSLIDILPTLVQEVGGTVPNDLDGTSLSALAAQRPPKTRPVYITLTRKARLTSVLENDWKVICDMRRPASYKLYNIGRDPGEQVNVRGRQPRVAKRLSRLAMERVRKEISRGENAPSLEVADDAAKQLKALGYLD